jgi:hypothetical protein
MSIVPLSTPSVMCGFRVSPMSRLLHSHVWFVLCDQSLMAACENEAETGLLSNPPWWLSHPMLHAEVNSEVLIDSIVTRRIPLAAARRHSDDESKLQRDSEHDD